MDHGLYDPELDLTYWGTGNAGPWNPAYRKGDSLYSASVIAVRPKTGEMVWHYQFTPNDSYDYDGVNENVIADLRVDGEMRKVIMHADRNGFFYVIDRTNGKLVRAYPFGKVNWATHVDMNTGRPVETDVQSASQRRRGSRTVAVFGHQELGTDGVQPDDRNGIPQHDSSCAVSLSIRKSTTRRAPAMPAQSQRASVLSVKTSRAIIRRWIR